MGKFLDFLVSLGERRSRWEIEKLARVRPDLFDAASNETRHVDANTSVKSIRYANNVGTLRNHNPQSA